MHKLLKSALLLFIALPAFSDLKAMDTGWMLLTALSGSALAHEVAVSKPFLSKSDVILVGAGTFMIATNYHNTRLRAIAHRKRGLQRCARNIQQKLNVQPKRAIIYLRDEPIGSVPDYAGPAQLAQNLNLPDDAPSLQSMLLEIERREKLIKEICIAEKIAYAGCALPAAAAVGIAAWTWSYNE